MGRKSLFQYSFSGGRGGFAVMNEDRSDTVLYDMLALEQIRPYHQISGGTDERKNIYTDSFFAFFNIRAVCLQQ